jgi:nicotinamidase/pyrazinamidase
VGYKQVPNESSVTLPKDVFSVPQIVLEKQTLDVFESCHADELVERLGTKAEFLVFGVVTEYCVRLAAKGLLQRGRRVTVIPDSIETLSREAGERTTMELKTLGANFLTTNEALSKFRVNA